MGSFIANQTTIFDRSASSATIAAFKSAISASVSSMWQVEAEVDQHVLTMMLFGALDRRLAAVLHKNLLDSRNHEQCLTNSCVVGDRVRTFHGVVPFVSSNETDGAIPLEARSSSTYASRVRYALVDVVVRVSGEQATG